MHVRMTRITASPENLERAIGTFDQNVATPYREQRGFAGIALAVDRQAGRAVGVTFWESEAALNATDDLAKDIRARSGAENGLQFDEVESYEVAIQERAQPAKAGTFLRGNRGQGPVDRLDQAVRELSDNIPAVKAQKGFRSLVCGVNRKNGKFFISSVWDTAADRDASEGAVKSLRQQITQTAQAGQIEVEHYEVVYADIPVRAGAGT
jgi:heme-degrading monooxygenase HmoA